MLRKLRKVLPRSKQHTNFFQISVLFPYLTIVRSVKTVTKTPVSDDGIGLHMCIMICPATIAQKDPDRQMSNIVAKCVRNLSQE